METIIVLLMVLLAAYMLGKKIWKQIKTGDCGCGCSGSCKSKDSSCSGNCSSCGKCYDEK